MFVPSGSRLSWAGDFSPTAFMSESSTDAIQFVGSQLRNKYNLIVERAHNGMGWGDFASGTITLDLRSDMDRGNGSNGVEDIRGNVQDEFANAGNACNSSRIISTTIAGQKQQTGAPSDEPDKSGNPNSDSCSGVFDCLTSGEFSSAWDNLTNQIEAGSIGLIIGAAVVIGVVVYISLKP